MYVGTATAPPTRKLFWDNPYLRSTRAKITEVDGNTLMFDRTIAFSFSGGQESDVATINGVPLLTSYIEGINIRYRVPDSHGFSVGDSVLMKIDWVRRNKLMRYHMLCELVLAITNRYFGHLSDGVELRPNQIDDVDIVKVMARMTDSGAYVDFDHPDFSEPLKEIQRELDRVIDADLPIEKGYIDETTQERYWRIPNLATIPCGGTHVRSTGEIGRAVLRRDKTTSKVTSTGKAQRVKIKLVDESPTHPGDEE